jgi:hypothetical protein
MVNDLNWRRSLFFGAGLAMGVAAVLIFAIIPRVKLDTTATQGNAVPAFWVLAIIHIIIMVFLSGTGYINRRKGCIMQGSLFSTGIVAILSGLLLLDAASAISDMPGLISLKLFFYGMIGADILTGIVSILLCF